MQNELATSAMLRGDAASMIAGSDVAWITTAAQMGMGFILPFALVFVAIPLETSSIPHVPYWVSWQQVYCARSRSFAPDR